MLTVQRAISNDENDHNQDSHQHHGASDDEEHIRDIHALTPPCLLPVNGAGRRETSRNSSSSLSMSSETGSSENFTTLSGEFNALVLAGSSVENNDSDSIHTLNNHLTRIGEEELPAETNHLAIVPDSSPLDQGSDQQRNVGSGASGAAATSSGTGSGSQGEVSVHRVKKEEVESKISAWQNAKVAKINNRFKREEAIINGLESEQVQKATSWMKKVEVYM